MIVLESVVLWSHHDENIHNYFPNNLPMISFLRATDAH